LRSDIDIIPDVPQLARHVYLVEVQGPSRYCLRVIGSAIVEMAGRDPTGRTIDRDLFPDTASEHIGALDFVVLQSRPGIIRGRPRGFPDDVARIEIIGLPLLARAEGPVGFVVGTLSAVAGNWVQQLRAQRTGHTTFELFTVSPIQGPGGPVRVEPYDG
jgi:hypothetical protein